MVVLFLRSSAVKRDFVIVISDDLKHDSSTVKVFVHDKSKSVDELAVVKNYINCCIKAEQLALRRHFFSCYQQLSVFPLSTTQTENTSLLLC